MQPPYNPYIELEKFIKNFLSTTDRNWISRDYILSQYLEKVVDERSIQQIRRDITFIMKKYNQIPISGNNVAFFLQRCLA